jgi:hypothetical protein
VLPAGWSHHSDERRIGIVEGKSQQIRAISAAKFGEAK